MSRTTVDDVRISMPRLRARLDALAEIGAIDGGGCARLALTDEDRLGHHLVVMWMHDLGLRVDIDEIGNVVCTWPAESAEPPVLTRRHIHTRGPGGPYDGTVGFR